MSASLQDNCKELEVASDFYLSILQSRRIGLQIHRTHTFCNENAFEVDLNGTSTPISRTTNVSRTHALCNDNGFEVDLIGTSNPSQEPQISTEPIRSVEAMSTHAPATVRMEPHVIIFQRATGNASLQICFQTVLPALNWAVREK